MAVDLGSSNGKILLCELDSSKRLSVRLVSRFIMPRLWLGGHLSINVYGIYEEICAAIRMLANEGVYIDSMGVDSWASDFGLVTEEGECVGLPVFYRDARCAGMTGEVEKTIDYAALYRLTTQRRMDESTLCQLLAVKRKSSLLARDMHIMSIGDLVMHFFTPCICNEFTVASYTQMFSMSKMSWEDEVFDLFDLPRSLQTKIVWPGEQRGRTSGDVARYCGQGFDVISPAVHDTSSAVAAIPAVDHRDWAFIATGTWFLVGMELDKPGDIELSYQNNFSNTGLAFKKNMLKRNVSALWLIQECKRAWDKTEGGITYPQIVEQAEREEAFAAFIDTDAEEFFRSDYMPLSIVQYLKRTGQADIEISEVGKIARIIYESIAMKCRYALDKLIEVSGREVEVLYIVGGASGIVLLNGMIASATGREVIAGVPDASGVGNGLLQAYGCGSISEQELRQIVSDGHKLTRYQPDESLPLWEESYRRFCNVCGC